MKLVLFGDSEVERDAGLVAEIGRRCGTTLALTGRAAQGTLGGAIFVEYPTGRQGVVTRFLGTVEHARRTAQTVNAAAASGIPVARHRHVVLIDDGVFFLQDRIAGFPADEATPDVIDAIVATNDLFADAAAGSATLPRLQLHLQHSGDPVPDHGVLAGHSTRSRRVLALIRNAGRSAPTQVAGDDLLHVDLTLSNVLFDDAGTVTGVVDWNLGAYRGDRYVALVKTRFDLEWLLRAEHGPAVDAAVDHLDHILAERLDPILLRSYWAHRMLYQLHWALPMAPPDVVDWHLAMAEQRLR